MFDIITDHGPDLFSTLKGTSGPSVVETTGVPENKLTLPEADSGE